MSGHELREEQMGLVHRPTDHERWQWALRLARAAVAKGHTRDDIVSVLEAIGLVDPAQPLPQSKTDALGMTVYPASQRLRRERNREYKRAARERARGEEAS